MTIIDVKNQIFTFFLTNDIFSLDSDSDSIIIDDAQKDIKNNIISCAMEIYEKANIVKKISIPNKFGDSSHYWILGQPIEDLTQNVTLSVPTSDMIAETINAYRKANSIHGESCDKMSISEKDIINLVNICHELLNNAE